jgi:3D (Asp-Asp-Asp) domain-containing protein
MLAIQLGFPANQPVGDRNGSDGDAPELLPTIMQISADDDDFDGPVVRRRCRVTAYCDRGITAAGVPSGVGQCAAPADIPLGSIVYIPELGREFVVTDRTHKRFRHNTVDLFMPSRTACLEFGRKYLTCEFTICVDPPRYGTLQVASALQGRR